MIRRTLTPRPDARAKVEAEGLIWHTAADGTPYWDESAYYSFTATEIETVESATAELYRLFLAAGQAIVNDRRLLDCFGIPVIAHQAIRDAWNAEPPALNFGRFDLGWDGSGPPKLFEFNCDTPTSLLEAAVIQWSWKEEVFPQADQFTSLHDKLVAKWADIAAELPPTVYFAHVADQAGEDAVTTSYLRDTAEAAGLATVPILVDDLGWDEDRRCFVDLDEAPIEALFKLYPWEWLMDEAFATQLVESLDRTVWIEPIWKMIWSNKAILPILWELNPGHPNLLPASFDVPAGDAVAKPLLAREGANVAIRKAGAVVAETPGEYGEEGYVYQDIYRLPEPAPGCFPVIGSWIVDGEPAGMGIREDGLITTKHRAVRAAHHRGLTRIGRRLEQSRQMRRIGGDLVCRLLHLGRRLVQVLEVGAAIRLADPIDRADRRDRPADIVEPLQHLRRYHVRAVLVADDRGDRDLAPARHPALVVGLGQERVHPPPSPAWRRCRPDRARSGRRGSGCRRRALWRATPANRRRRPRRTSPPA